MGGGGGGGRGGGLINTMIVSWHWGMMIQHGLKSQYHLYYTPTRREGAILQSPCPSVSSHIFVKDVSAATGRNDFIFDTWLWHSDLYRVSPFQAYRTYTSCLPCDLKFFMFVVTKTFVTDISVSTGRNDLIFDNWLWHGDLYRVSPFQVYRTSTSCLQCDIEFFMFAVIKTFVTDISASTGRNDLIFDIWLLHGELYRVSPFQVYLYWFIMICAELDVSD